MFFKKFEPDHFKTMPVTRSKRKARTLSDENTKGKANVEPEKKCPRTAKKSKPASTNPWGIHPDSTVAEVVFAIDQILLEVRVLVWTHDLMFILDLMLLVSLLLLFFLLLSSSSSSLLLLLLLLLLLFSLFLFSLFLFSLLLLLCVIVVCSDAPFIFI